MRRRTSSDSRDWRRLARSEQLCVRGGSRCARGMGKRRVGERRVGERRVGERRVGERREAAPEAALTMLATARRPPFAMRLGRPLRCAATAPCAAPRPALALRRGYCSQQRKQSGVLCGRLVRRVLLTPIASTGAGA
eukprot:6213739-Pleurochrysis_carterae.AAC.2